MAVDFLLAPVACSWSHPFRSLAVALEKGTTVPAGFLKSSDGLFVQFVEVELGLRAETAECELIDVLQQGEAFASLDADHDVCVVCWYRNVLEWRVKCCGDGVLIEQQIVVHGWELRNCEVR